MEDKHHKLARSLRSGPTDRDLKPNAVTRDQLNVGFSASFESSYMLASQVKGGFSFQKIVEYPPTRNLTSEEKDLVWKFRFYLSSSKKVSARCIIILL